MHKHRSTAQAAVGFAKLDDRECLGLLQSEHLGRLGLTAGALPVVVPVEYQLVDRSIIFATEAGTKLNGARKHAVACLEIDGTEPTTGAGWTVLATGRLRELPDATSAVPDHALALLPWGLPVAEHYVALEIELLGGSTSGVKHP